MGNDQSQKGFKRKYGSKTPNDMESSMNSSVIMDGGTGSEGGVGLKINLNKSMVNIIHR